MMDQELMDPAAQPARTPEKGGISSPLRLWVLTNAPSPYQVELFNEAARRRDLSLCVRYMRGRSPSGVSVDAATAYDQKTMRGTLPAWARDEFRLHPRAVWEVIRGRHDVQVLSGLYTSPTFFLCALTAFLFRRRYVLWLERPHAAKDGGRNWPRRMAGFVKQRYLRWLLRHASNVWCIGSQAAREYHALGVADDAIRMLTYCCRSDRFHADAARSAAWRERHDLQNKCVFLFSGQLIHRKGVDTLLRSFAQAASRRADAVLLLLGDGPKKAEYHDLARSLGIDSQVRFLGHRPQAELPEWFAVADAFAFPSRHDGWAVVLNEACAAGLPIIASSQTGAAHDLVAEGINGFILDCEDVAGWGERLSWCLEHRDKLPVMGAASRQKVESFTTEAGAARMAQLAHDLMQPALFSRETAEVI